MDEKHAESQQQHVEHMTFRDDRDEYESLLAHFDEKRQRKLLRKIDWRLLSVLGIFYLISFMDRSNIGNARLQGLEDDLGLSPAQFNMCLTIFFIPYALFEVPSNIMLKFTKPSTWLPILMVAWGLVLMCMGWVHNYAGILAARFFLGVAEAGLFPAAAYLCSTWYLRREMQIRIALFYTAASLAGSFSGLLAYGIGFMKGIRGYNGWRWIFILEGAATMAIGLIAIPFICDNPRKSKWLDEDEKRFIELRLQFDGHERGYKEPDFKMKYVVQAFTDFKVYLGTILFAVCCTGTYSLSYSLPTTIKILGYTSAHAQLLTIPVYATACLACLGNAFLADKLQRRYHAIVVPYGISLIGCIICLTVSPVTKPGVIYFALFLIPSGIFAAVPAVICWISNNLAGQWKRSIGIGLEFGLGNLGGGVIGSNIFLSRESPDFRTAYIILLSFFAMGILAATAQLLLMMAANKKSRQLTERTSPEELARLDAKYKDDGDKSPFFLYTL